MTPTAYGILVVSVGISAVLLVSVACYGLGCLWKAVVTPTVDRIAGAIR